MDVTLLPSICVRKAEQQEGNMLAHVAMFLLIENQ